MYLFIRRVIKLIVVLIEVYHCVNYIQNFTPHPAVKVSSIWRGNCWGLSVWILANLTTYHIFCTHCTVFLEYADMEYECIIYLSKTVLFILYLLPIDFIGCLWLQKYVHRISELCLSFLYCLQVSQPSMT